MLDPAATLFVTRPQPDADALCERLRARGRIAVAYPVLAIEPVDDVAALARTMASIEDYRLVVFVSPNAIRQALPERGSPWPATTAIGVMGPGSAKALQDAGVGVPAVQPARRHNADAGARFDSESLFAALDAELGLSRGFEGRALVVRGNGGRAWFADRLRGLGIVVDEIEAYRRVTPEPGAEASAVLATLQATGAPVAFVVTSSDAVSRLLDCVARSLEGKVDTAVARAWACGETLVTQHPRIVEAARRTGFSRVVLVDPDDLASGAGIE
jgi:uroporphyrinogen III methyltransferase/synthase